MKTKNIFIYISLVIITFALVYVVHPFISAILIGAVFASATHYFYKQILKIKNKPKLAAFVIVLSFAILIVTPIGFVILKGVQSSIDLLTKEVNLQEGIATLSNEPLFIKIKSTLNEFGVVSGATKALNYLVGFLVNTFEDFIKALPTVTFSLFVGLITMYYGLRESSFLKKYFLKNSLLSQSDNKKLIHAINESCHSVILTNLIGGLVQSILIAITAIATSTPGVFVLAFTAFVLSFVPIFGTAPITIGLALFAFLNHSPTIGVVWLVVGIFIGMSDNIVKAWVLRSSYVQLHPLLGLLSVVGGLITLGIPGVILGPLIANIFVGLFPILYSARI